MTMPITNYLPSNDCIMISYGRTWKEVAMVYFKVSAWDLFGRTKKRPQKISVMIVRVPVKTDSS
jgi:hypothetical protein